jgi:hypothetical protein
MELLSVVKNRTKRKKKKIEQRDVYVLTRKKNRFVERTCLLFILFY